ncbi:hypothetical protein [Kineosporia succinea]
MTGVLAVLRHVRFSDGTRLPADPPRDTRDPRAIACRDHRTGCDCREADLCEAITEARSEAHHAFRAETHLRAVLRLHAPRLRRWVTGTGCSTCLDPWPCPTWSLASSGLPEREREQQLREAESRI